MAMGTTVFRIRVELIFRRCWNLITPSAVVQGFPAQCRACRVSQATDSSARAAGTREPRTKPAPAAFLESRRGHAPSAARHIIV